MLSEAPRACRQPGCGNVTRDSSGFCEQHKKQDRKQTDEQRGTVHQRGYTRRWHRFRSWWLKNNPLCYRCQEKGTVRLADMVHHIKPVDERPDLLCDTENVMSLCSDCHTLEHGGVKKV